METGKKSLTASNPLINRDAFYKLINVMKTGNLEDTLKVIEDENLDVNSETNDGMTLLNIAVFNGHHSIEITKHLVENMGADVNGGHSGYSPLWDASRNKSTMKVLYLVRMGANPNCFDKNKQNPLHLMATLQQSDWILDLQRFLLFEAGVDVNWKNWKGYTCLQTAIQRCDTGFVRLIVQYACQENEYVDPVTIPVGAERWLIESPLQNDPSLLEFKSQPQSLFAICMHTARGLYRNKTATWDDREVYYSPEIHNLAVRDEKKPFPVLPTEVFEGLNKGNIHKFLDK